MSDRHIDIALAAPVVPGALLALTAFAFKLTSSGLGEFRWGMFVLVGWSVASAGGILGVIAGIPGVPLKRFPIAILAGAAIPVAAISAGLFWIVVDRRTVEWFSASGFAWLVAAACFGGICSATTALVSRSPNWHSIRYSLVELITIMTLYCVYLACLRVIFS